MGSGNGRGKKKGLLNSPHTTGSFCSNTPPVLITVLDATKCAESNRRYKEQRPYRSNDQSGWENAKGSSWHDERGGRLRGGRSRSSGLRAGVCWAGCGFGKHAVYERCFLRRERGGYVLACGRVACCKVDFWNQKGLKGFPVEVEEKR